MGIMTLAEIMDKSLEILRKYFKTVLTFSLGYGAIFFAGAFFFIIGGSIFAVLSAALFKNVVVTVIVVSLLLVVLGAFVLTSNIGMIKISAQDFTDEKIYASDAIGNSLKSTLKVFGIVALGVLIFLPVIAIFAAVVYVLYKGYKFSMVNFGVYKPQDVFLLIFSILTFLLALLAIAGYITLLIFSLHAVAIENKGPVKAIRRSMDLVKGNYFEILGCVVLFSLTVYAIKLSLTSAVALITSCIYFVMKLMNISKDFTTFLVSTYTITQWPLNILSWLVISPIGVIMTSMLYFNQRFKKEGYDLELRLRGIQNNGERKQASEIL